MSSWFSPAQIARARAIRPSKILTWIHNGELEALNLATNRGGRPRWRISVEALAAFDRTRSNRAALAPAQPARRPRRAPDVIEFF